jgi:hypothetical protein
MILEKVVSSLRASGKKLNAKNIGEEYRAQGGTGRLPNGYMDIIKNLDAGEAESESESEGKGLDVEGGGFFSDIFNKAKDAVMSDPMGAIKKAYEVGKKGVDVAQKLKGVDIRNNPMGAFHVLSGLGGALPMKYRKKFHDNVRAEYGRIHGAGFFDTLKKAAMGALTLATGAVINHVKNDPIGAFTKAVDFGKQGLNMGAKFLGRGLDVRKHLTKTGKLKASSKRLQKEIDRVHGAGFFSNLLKKAASAVIDKVKDDPIGAITKAVDIGKQGVDIGKQLLGKGLKVKKHRKRVGGSLA